MKNYLLLFLLIMSINSNAQTYSIYYNGNFPNEQFGVGASFTIDKYGGFFNYAFGDKSQGNDRQAEDNSGIYQIGTWGNKATGVNDNYLLEEYGSFNLGFIYKAYEYDRFTFEPYIGIGATTHTITEKSFIQAEDVSSGFNTLGYYWVKWNYKQIKTTNANFCLGTFLKYKFILLGIGYHINPNSFQFSLGVNFKM